MLDPASFLWRGVYNKCYKVLGFSGYIRLSKKYGLLMELLLAEIILFFLWFSNINEDKLLTEPKIKKLGRVTYCICNIINYEWQVYTASAHPQVCVAVAVEHDNSIYGFVLASVPAKTIST